MQRSFTRTAATALVVLGLATGTAIAQGYGGGGPGGGGPGGGGPGGGPGGGLCCGAGTPGSMMLQRLDTNGDGKISEAEFRAGHAQMFDAADTNRDGKLSREELAQAAVARQASRAERKLMRMDANGDGSVSREEFEQAGAWRFDSRDVNGDDQLTTEEMARGGRGGRGGATGQPPGVPAQ